QSAAAALCGTDPDLVWLAVAAPAPVPTGGDASEGQRPVPLITATPTTSGPWERHTYTRSEVDDAGAVWTGKQCSHPSEGGHGLCHACVGGPLLPSVEAGQDHGQGQPPRPRRVSATGPGGPPGPTNA